MIKVKDKIHCLITLSKTTFAGGIASNSKKNSRLLVPHQLSTTSGKLKQCSLYQESCSNGSCHSSCATTNIDQGLQALEDLFTIFNHNNCYQLRVGDHCIIENAFEIRLSSYKIPKIFPKSCLLNNPKSFFP